MKKSENHHWWPEGVSQFWKNQDGCAHWLQPDGNIVKAPPKNFGVIGNAHFIKLGRKAGEDTVWDENFEKEFQQADDQFPAIIEWLETLDREDRTHGFSRRQRYVPQFAPEQMLARLVECVVSLAMRAPMNRQAFVGLAERLRGPLPERERNTLIAMNMKGCQRRVTDSIGTSAKFAIIFSPEKEFVFGDGFYHNIRAPIHPPMMPRLLVPLTPRVSVLMARPTRYAPEPKVSTLVVSVEEATVLNRIIEIYAKEAIFYRSERPTVTEHFAAGKHLELVQPGENPIEEMIEDLPGVPDRDRSLDLLFKRI